MDILETSKWSAAEVRALRGSRSRAAFADSVGVSPLTIYRWELPADASESRRPRRASREKLRALAKGRAVEDWTPPDAILHLLADARWVDAERLAVRALADGTDLDEASRAFLLTCVAKIQLLTRGDALGALATTASLLGRVDDFPPLVRGLVHTTAALLYATPTLQLFDPVRAAGHAARVPEGLDQTLMAMASVAGAWAAWHEGNAMVFRRRVEAAAAFDTDEPVARLLVHEVQALAAELDGRPTEAQRGLDAVADRALSLGLVPVAHRAAGWAALLRLGNAERPESVLAKLDAVVGDLSPGQPSLVVLAARAEAVFRQARWDDAWALSERALAMAEAAEWPAIELVACQSRLHFQVGGAPAIRSLAVDYAARWRGLPVFEATATFLAAVADLCEGDLEATAVSMVRAKDQLTQVGTQPTLAYLAHTLSAGTMAYLGDLAGAEGVLHTLERSLERRPCPWSDLVAVHVRGLVASLRGRAVEADRLYQAATDTLDRAGDIGEAARMRRARAIGAHVLGAADAAEQLDATEAELAALGIEPSPVHTRARVEAHLRPVSHALDSAPAALVVPFRRLARRGFTPDALRGEIVGAARMLVADPGVELIEGDAAVEGDSAVVSDGLGGRWQLVAAGPSDPGRQTSLELIAVTASLALELATLREGPRSSKAPARLPGVIAESQAMRSLVRDLDRVARSRSTVLIRGESGSGKEVVARAVHTLSRRANGPFVTFNSATVPPDLFDGQLFGYRKGAFTGATRDHQGVIRAAHGGTLFLDEIGDMPPGVQAKLLRFLENGEVLPLGETGARQVDVRVVAATHRDLDRMVSQRTFREDLFYRLQVIPVRVPPLRDRRDDILPLARHFAAKLADGRPPELSSDAIVALRGHHWRGNVRELRNVIERAMAFAPDARVLEAEQLRL